ncbi:MAG: hypothetical protein LBB72_08605 [Spirochaetaceae bacterium]|jgi:hypothetical protein|nr:hypothetical protein [Spirochaetaceae bacterium]
MNKKTLFLLLLAVVPFFVFAQELKLSGEAKSGIYWEEKQQEGLSKDANVTMMSKDDAGSGRGRFRLNMDYDNGNNFGFKARLNWETWSDTQPQWPYAFGYGNFFENQMTVSVGKLGASPWGTDGPEMWKELEAASGGGIRTEWKPAFIPGLNAGFVLSYFNSDRDQGWDIKKPLSLLNILRESVIGISYSNPRFLVRFAYRFDDEFDATQENKNRGGKGEDELVYRLEERILKEYLPGFQIWALGYWFGVTSEYPEMKLFQNWLFFQYEPELFTAQVRFGYDYIESRSDFYVKPSFYLNLFDKLLSVGAMFQYCQDFGDGKLYPGSPYRYLEVEPKIQLNFWSDNTITSYIAFAYNWKREYVIPNYEGYPEGKDPVKQTQWMNLRFCVKF